LAVVGERYHAFLFQATQPALCQLCAVILAYRTFRQIPKAVDSYRKNPRYVIDSLIYKAPTGESETKNEHDKVKEFMDFVKRELWGTDLYRPIIEYYNDEEAQDLRKKSMEALKVLTITVDLELEAFRVIIVEPRKDYVRERQKYLKQIETTFLEHQFSGLPIYREDKNALLQNIFVVLGLKSEGGGEALDEEIEKMLIKKED